jgi:hypothetical protein
MSDMQSSGISQRKSCTFNNKTCIDGGGFALFTAPAAARSRLGPLATPFACMVAAGLLLERLGWC